MAVLSSLLTTWLPWHPIRYAFSVAKDHMIPHKQYLKDEFVSDGSTVYKEGQSVRGKVCHYKL